MENSLSQQQDPCPGDVRLRFESESRFSQDSLYCQNASYLAGTRFMRAMDNWEYRDWILQAGTRLPSFNGPKQKSLLALFLANLLLVLIPWWLNVRQRLNC